jgi:hypothetical protein
MFKKSRRDFKKSTTHEQFFEPITKLKQKPKNSVLKKSFHRNFLSFYLLPT